MASVTSSVGDVGSVPCVALASPGCAKPNSSLRSRTCRAEWTRRWVAERKERPHTSHVNGIFVVSNIRAAVVGMGGADAGEEEGGEEEEEGAVAKANPGGGLLLLLLLLVVVLVRPPRNCSDCAE